MEQIALPLMGRLDGPATAPSSLVARPTSYREAVRLAWMLRRVQFSTHRQLAAEALLYPPHVSDYLNADDRPQRRSLPAESIPAFECFVGNTLVTQWLASKGKLTVLEELQATKAAI